MKRKIDSRKLIMGVAYAYVMLPLVLFFLGWMKWYFAIPAAVVMVAAFVSATREEMTFWLPEWNVRNIITLVAVAVISVMWVYWSGVGGFVVQTTDHFWRNEIFALLVEKKWPVVGSYLVEGGMDDRMLSYYIGFWLPAALIGKIFGLQAGFAAQFVWGSLGVFLVMILMGSLSKRWNVLLPLGFVFFSGMDALGVAIRGDDLHDWASQLEWWAGMPLQYSSHTTQLFWVFNQAIYGWLILLLILMQEKNRVVVCVLGCALLCCTFPFVGALPFFLYIVIRNGYKIIKNEGIWAAIKDLFSWENVLGGGISGILSYIFLSSNTAANNSSLFDMMIPSVFQSYLLFSLLEFGILMLLLLRDQEKNPLYWITMVILIILPFSRIGGGADFAMRASIPALVMLFLMAFQSLMNALSSKSYAYATVIMIILLVGAVTPIHEMYRMVNATKQFAITGEAFVKYVEEEDIMCAENFSCSMKDSRFARVFMKK